MILSRIKHKKLSKILIKQIINNKKNNKYIFNNYYKQDE